jgi:hypothetical protein
VLGARDPQFFEKSPWQVSFSWRYQKSDRHFRGSEEEDDRQAEHSEVINTLNLLDVSFTRNLNSRWSLTFGIPYLMAERSLPIRNEERETIGRTVMQARDFGDLTIGAQRWMLDPFTHLKTNVQLGFGVKLPTGPDNVVDTRLRYEDGEIVPYVQTVDQSIQPGDGGFGFVFNVAWFYRVLHDRCAWYFSGTYLFNPEGTNGVYTYRSRETEAIMSIADQYLARLGAQFAVSKKKNVSLGIGGRVEGIPAEDVFGSSEGFRRPGYAVSVEPNFNVNWGLHNVSVAVPIAVYRNRVHSVPDNMRGDGRAGDAAFADWLLIVSYSRRFGGKNKATAATPTCNPPAESTPSGGRR